MSGRQLSEAYNHGWDDAEIGAPIAHPYADAAKQRDYVNGYRTAKQACGVVGADVSACKHCTRDGWYESFSGGFSHERPCQHCNPTGKSRAALAKARGDAS